jgi:hypothetical protein
VNFPGTANLLRGILSFELNFGSGAFSRLFPSSSRRDPWNSEAGAAIAENLLRPGPAPPRRLY